MKILQRMKDLKIIGQSVGHNKLTEKMLHFQIEALINESEALYLDHFYQQFDLIKQALRRRNHIFTNSLPDFSVPELKQLISLAHEAGSVYQIFVPLVFQTENLKQIKQISGPFLANIRLPNNSEIDLENQFLNFLLFLVLIDDSEFKKADLMTIPGHEGYNLLEVRLVFTSGSVARILFSNQIGPKDSEIEIFRQKKPILRFQAEDLSASKAFESEQNAAEHFQKAVHHNECISINLNHMHQARYILNDIKSKLNYSGNFFPEKRYAV
ncbi:hypothetical protein [Mangrovibacterium lignilyticum]|uniref:hypothetical protein n=1 Tax=Mangrovibacterium lignilyticum TaxID=2668052 RepID=UPI0013D08476|nr:hypothetical protein [Mangrovibacterium lignilyticum]